MVAKPHFCEVGVDLCVQLVRDWPIAHPEIHLTIPAILRTLQTLNPQSCVRGHKPRNATYGNACALISLVTATHPRKRTITQEC